MSSGLKAITQETFDHVVQENIEDFEMDEIEAVNDAIQQFKSQGVNLSMIIKANQQNGGHKVIQLVEKVKNEMKNENSEMDPETLKLVLEELASEFKKDLANRYQSSKMESAHIVLFKGCQDSKNDPVMLLLWLSTFASLIDGQPDLISNEGLDFMFSLIQDADNPDLATILLKIIKFSCTKHEGNRVCFVKCGGIEKILTCMEKFKEHTGIVKETCGSLRCLSLDDDVRVPFGKAHDHTKLIVTEHSGIERIFQLIKVHEHNPSVVSELCSTMGKLMVRTEFCQQMVDLGGLKLILSICNLHVDKQNLVRNCVTLLKAISGNDDVKVAVIKAGGAEFLLTTLNKHKSNALICEACLAALTTLALRNPFHCDVIMSKNAALLISGVMKEHSDHCGVQRQACMAIRNLVARTRSHTKAFIDVGAERLIRRAREAHQKELEDESKAALRDLEVEVDLKERWRGENVGITS